MNETSLIEQALSEIDYDIKLDKNTYTNKENNIVPRVTEILSSTISEQYIIQWANSLGFKHKGYTAELTKAANIGSIAHGCIERFLKTGEQSNNVSFLAFLTWWQMLLKNNKVDIIGMEEKLVCKFFGGTYDALLNINGKIYLVDFKTSNHVSYRYMLQLAAYRYMLYTEKGINIDGCIVLQLSKDEPLYNEYVLDFSIPEQYAYIESCLTAFLSLTYAFYNTAYVKEGYKKIFGGGKNAHEKSF